MFMTWILLIRVRQKKNEKNKIINHNSTINWLEIRLIGKSVPDIHFKQLKNLLDNIIIYVYT